MRPLVLFSAQGGRHTARVFQGRRLLLIVRGSQHYVMAGVQAFCEAWQASAEELPRQTGEVRS